MTTVHVGLPSLRGSLARYAERFDLLEVRPVDTPLPKPAKTRAWRKEVPPAFVFSVVLPSIVSSLRQTPEADAALATTLEHAAALEARCLVLVTQPDVTPTALNKRRLAALVERLPRDVVTVAWEPRGLWSTEETGALGRELDLAIVSDVTRDAPARGPVLYTRLRGIGAGARSSAAGLERARLAFSGRRGVYAVVECDGAARVAKALREPLAPAARVAAGSVVRPAARLSAEDEEQ